jgi:hypothetical protein
MRRLIRVKAIRQGCSPSRQRRLFYSVAGSLTKPILTSPALAAVAITCATVS